MAKTSVHKAASMEGELDVPQIHILSPSPDPLSHGCWYWWTNPAERLQKICLSQGGQKDKGLWLEKHLKKG